jgi:predicted DNA-binding transcriptional regulator AlpA
MKATSSVSASHPVAEVVSALVSPDELAGIAEVAEICGVPKRTAIRYSQRADFPEPLDRLAAGPVWRRVDVEAWAKRTLPLPTGRPRKREGSASRSKRGS